ncbi:hypothetical protein [Pseudonocardia kunmingensis]|uniref:hypothetical protein n=1 Tax=Pseudonocardia kunmingensis TaxID=630975 RepID=UPI001FECA600|nr:hypothetical protein [Pseudonocardia kunmingensis]
MAGDRAALARGALRAGRCHHLQAQRVGPHRAAQVRRPHRGRPRADPARAGRGGGRAAGRAGRHRDRPGHGLPGGRALPRAGLRDPRRGHRPRRRCAGHARRRVRRRARAAVLVPAHRRPRAGQRPRDGVGAAAGGRGDAPARERGPPTPVDTHPIHISGATVEAAVYDRTTLRAGHVVTGPAIVTEMDSTTLVLPGHAATVHPSGSLLITPQEA